jgi:alanine racemase
MALSRTASAELQIDLRAIGDNWKLLANRAAPGVGCAAVVKADAYGLGVRRVAPALYARGCRDFFVAQLEEALQLKPLLAWDARVFVLQGVFAGTEVDCLAASVVPVLNSLDQVNRWQALAQAEGRRLPAALQFDTGMSRLGLSTAEVQQLATQDLNGIELVLSMSHLVAAEEPANPVNALQLARFTQLRQRWSGIPSSLANSSGVFLGSGYHFNLLRPGAALYGVTPNSAEVGTLRPVVRLQARMIQWRTVECGEGVGYNHTWTAPYAGRVATLAVGYADGLLRALSNRMHLRFQGQVVPLIGRVSMDTLTVDVSQIHADRLVPGTLFDVIDDVHDINAVAQEAGTNAYEVLTSLGHRYTRNYSEV